MLRHICCSIIPSPLLKTHKGNVSEYDNGRTTTSATFLSVAMRLSYNLRPSRALHQTPRVPPTYWRFTDSFSFLLGRLLIALSFRYCGYKPRVLRINMKTILTVGRCFPMCGTAQWSSQHDFSFALVNCSFAWSLNANVIIRSSH